MKLLGDGTAETTYEDDDGAEWELLILYTHREFEPEQCNPDRPGLGPGCDEEITDIEVMRNEPVYDVKHWYRFEDFTDSQEADWKTEIMEAINQEFIDGMGEE